MTAAKTNALVLGASKKGGTGWAIAEALARAGAHVTVGARSAAGIAELANQIGGQAVACDVTREDDVAGIAAKAASAGNGRIDIAVLAAGEGTGGMVDDIAEDQLRGTFDLNYFGPVYFVRHVTRHMPEGGSIVLMSSIAASRAWPGYFSYGCSKAALEMLVRYAALEFAPRGIRVNAVAPGPIQTEASASRHNHPDVRAVFADEIPLGRTVKASEVAEVVTGLAISSPWVTGEIIHVDGGMHLRRAPDPERLMAAMKKAGLA
ncbi:MAG: SDR family oxidoreductase [Sphingomonadales bacterium]